VFTVHVQPVRQRALWKRAVLGWLLGQCTTVTAVSAETASRLSSIATALPQKITVTHGGADLQPLDSDDRRVQEFRERFRIRSGPVVCQVGVNYPLKVAGVVRLMHALKVVQEQFQDARLLVVGEGELRSTVAREAERIGVAESVTLTGFVPDISVPLAVADVYCHITLQDAAPLSVLEAMMCGKPIVAARTGGIPELVNDGVDAVLVEPEPPQIAEALIQLLSNPERANQLAKAARLAAIQRHSWQSVADQFATAYGLAGGITQR
jgi:glycosyltransferase involved in cell wall biosynthesis